MYTSGRRLLCWSIYLQSMSLLFCSLLFFCDKSDSFYIIQFAQHFNRILFTDQEFPEWGESAQISCWKHPESGSVAKPGWLIIQPKFWWVLTSGYSRSTGKQFLQPWQWAVTLHSPLYSLVKKAVGALTQQLLGSLRQLCSPLLQPQALRCSPLLPKGKCLCVSSSAGPSGLTASTSHTCPCDTL